MRYQFKIYAFLIFISVMAACSRPDEKRIITLSGSVVPDHEQLLNYLDQISEDYPDNADIMFQKAKVEFDMGRFTDAANSVNKAKECGKRDHETGFLTARILYHLGHQEEALRLGEELLSEGYVQVDLNEFMYHVYYDQDDFLKSIDQINFCIKRDPLTARYYYLKSKSYMQMKDSVNHEIYLEESLQRGYDYPDAYLSYIDLLSRRNETGKALIAIHKAVKAFPENQQIMVLYAKLLDNAGKADSAKVILRSLVRQGINNPLVLCSLAEFYKSEHKLDSTLYFVDKALSADSSCVDAYYLKGDVNRIRGNYYKAISIYQKLLTIHPDDPVAAREIKNISNYLSYLKRATRRSDSLQAE